uniref:Uncharacterized protein n=1 Tax=Anguilla anguilla TaxID=7936 RepID=A0A0E9TYM6_ANGAN
MVLERALFYSRVFI